MATARRATGGAKSANVATLSVDLVSELDELIAAQRSDDGQTVAEISAQVGLSDRRVKMLLQAAHGKGWLKVGRRTETGSDGRRFQQPVYRIEKPNGRHK